ncbi:MAG: glycosyltransferase family 2 protein [Alistipes sp.]|nr:glycosyltransferase family 2 protein [Alistipes sp.]
MSKKLDISVVVPLYNEVESLPELVAWIDRVARKNSLSYEIIMIDDGSTDGSFQEVERLRAEYPAIRGVSFMRNYGKSAALYVGFDMAEGEVVFTMDADLQDSPDEIPEMRRMILEEGYDLVSGWKRKRYDPIGKRWPSKFFNLTARVMSGIKLHDFNCGLKAYRRKVVKSIEVYGEMHRYIPILAKHAGFKRIGEKVVEHHERKYGKSKFGLERMVKGYLDLISVSFMSHFGRSPMYLFGGLGTLMFLFGGVTTIWVIADKLYSQANGLVWRGVTEQPLFYLALLAIVLGVQLFLAGFLGEMINRRSTDRNHYLVDRRTQDDNTDKK